MSNFQNTISTFNQGLSDDIRIQKKTVDDFAYSKNFDVFSNIKKIVPQRELSIIASVITNKIKTVIRLNNGYSTNGYVAGLGIVVGTTKPKIFISANYDTSFTTWTAATNGESANTNGAITTFVEYTNKAGASYVYGFRGGSAVWRWKSDDGTAFTETFQSVSYTYTAQGIVHPADDVLYLPYDNKIASLNDTTWNATAMAGIPSNYTISSIVPWGNYLAIIGKSTSGYGTTSRMWLWDRDSSLTTFTDNIDLSEGVAFAAGNIEGNIIIAQIITKNFLPTIIKLTRYSGGTPQVFKQITTNATTQLNPDINWSAVYSNRFYFSVDDTVGDYCGLWSVGRYGINYSYGVCLEKSGDAVDAATITTSIHSFLLVKDYWIIPMFANGTNYVSHTTNTTYFGSAVYETQKLSEGDITLKKLINGVSLAYESLPSGGTITLKVRTDANSSYRTIFTRNTAGETLYEANKCSDQSAIASLYKEIQFRIESTGGVVPLALSYNGEILNQLSK